MYSLNQANIYAVDKIKSLFHSLTLFPFPRPRLTHRRWQKCAAVPKTKIIQVAGCPYKHNHPVFKNDSFQYDS